jgi:hypothetical protein
MGNFKLAVLICAASLLLGSAAVPQPPPVPDIPPGAWLRDPGLRQLAIDVFLLRTINSMELTPQQMRYVRDALVKVKAESDAFLRDTKAALAAERQRLLRGSAADARTGLTRAKERGEQFRKRLTRILDGLEGKVSPVQLKKLRLLILGGARPGTSARPTGREGPPPRWEARRGLGPNVGLITRLVELLNEKIKLAG